MIPTFSGARYAVTLSLSKSVSYARYYSVIKYRTISCCNLSNSGQMFTLHQKIVRIMVGVLYNPERFVEIYSKNCRFCLFHDSTYFR